MSDKIQTFAEVEHWRLNFDSDRGVAFLAQDEGEGDAAVISLTVSQLPELADTLLRLHRAAVKSGAADGLANGEIEPVRPR